jgi:hypothetical protein
MGDLLLFILIVWGLGAFMWAIWHLFQHGIDEHNLLRTLSKTVCAPAWPIVGAVYLSMGIYRYMRTRFHSELRELLPEKKQQGVQPPIVTVADLASSGDAPYKPGQWIN